MQMETIIYWSTTGIVSAMMLFSAFMYVTKPEVKEGFTQMGFRGFFRVELAIAKVIGAVVLIVPMSIILKEWAYAGFTIVFISAFIAHTAEGHPISKRMAPIVFMVLLMISYSSLKGLLFF